MLLGGSYEFNERILQALYYSLNISSGVFRMGYISNRRNDFMVNWKKM